MCFRPVLPEMENKCPECGKDNEFGAEVCEACGAALEKQAPPPPGQAAGAPPKPPAGAPPKPPKPPVPPAGK